MIAGEVPLLRVPATWSTPAVAAGAMVLLAALDGLGAVLAKTWVRTGSWTIGGAGLVTFGLLFWVYSSSLPYAELSTVPLAGSCCCRLGCCSPTASATGWLCQWTSGQLRPG